jgi:hypothetical protein
MRPIGSSLAQEAGDKGCKAERTRHAGPSCRRSQAARRATARGWRAISTPCRPRPPAWPRCPRKMSWLPPSASPVLHSPAISGSRRWCWRPAGEARRSMGQRRFPQPNRHPRGAARNFAASMAKPFETLANAPARTPCCRHATGKAGMGGGAMASDRAAGAGGVLALRLRVSGRPADAAR